MGPLTTIGLAAKNTILIVESAKDRVDQDRSTIKAILKAARLRLRPIIMTSVAFILGVLPLTTATGAGSGAQNAIGIGVLAATAFGIFLVPVFFVLFRRGAETPLANTQGVASRFRIRGSRGRNSQRQFKPRAASQRGHTQEASSGTFKSPSPPPAMVKQTELSSDLLTRSQLLCLTVIAGP